METKARQVGGDPVSVQAQQDIGARYAEYKRLVARAVEVLGSELEATRWLSSAAPDLGNRTPLQFFVENGSDAVIDLLGRIEHGVFA